MKSCLALSVLLLFAAPVAAQTDFTATLDGAQAGTGSAASGAATLTLNAAQTALGYSVTLAGVDLDGLQTPADPNDDVLAMHIHRAPPGTPGPVIFGLISPGDDVDDIVINPVAGTLTGIWETTDSLTLQPGMNLTNFLADLNAGDLYFNVHTPANPGGEIRGQIVQVSPSVLEIPTLGEGALAFLALLLVAAGLLVLRRPRAA